MKFKVFSVMFCLIAGMLWTQLSAQSINRAYQDKGYGLFYTEVYCNGEVVDEVEGNLDFHIVVFFYNGVVWYKWQAKGSGVSTWTGEEFRYFEIDKLDYVNGIYTWHYHLRGDMGNDYVGFVTWDMNTDVMTPGHTVCH